jgi:hypothetical protein
MLQIDDFNNGKQYECRDGITVDDVVCMHGLKI